MITIKRNAIRILFFMAVLFLTLMVTNNVQAMIFTDKSGNEYEIADLPEDSSSFSNDYYFIYKNVNTYGVMTFVGFNEETMKVILTSSGYRISITNPGSAYFCFWDLKNGVWVDRGVKYTSDTNYGYYSATGSYPILFSTVDVYYGDNANTLFFEKNEIFLPVPPSVSNTEEALEKNNFQYFFVNPGSISSSDTINFSIRNNEYLSLPEGASFVGYMYSIDLNNTSSYYVYNEETDTYFYQIPKSDLPIYKGLDKESYSILLFYDSEDYSKYVETTFTINLISDEEKQLEDLNETNKGIFERIGDLLNYINPASENFFVYKLIDLLLEAIKGLFIPENGYFDTYFEELQDWFSDRLGFLYYPLDILFSVFDRFMDLGNGSMQINIPDIKEPVTNQVLISAQSLNFNEILENDTFGNLHNIYLLIVDATVYIGLVVLLYHKYEEVIAR